MKLLPLLVLVVVACKPDRSAKPAPAAPTPAPVAHAPAPAPKLAPPPVYTAPALPEGEVAPVQAGSAAAPPPVVPRDPAARVLGQLDADHDGKVTPAEVKASHLRFDDPAALDTDGDGQISRAELAAGLREQRFRARAGAKH